MQYARRVPDSVSALLANACCGVSRRRSYLWGIIRFFTFAIVVGLVCDLLFNLGRLMSVGCDALYFVYPLRPVTATVGEQRPGDPRQFVGQGDGGDIEAFGLFEFERPLEQAVILAFSAT